MMSRKQEALLVFDFDHTIINCNSDKEVRALAKNPVPQEVAALAHVNNGWTQYMQALFTFLHQEGVTQSEYEVILKNLPLVDGMKELMQAASEDTTVIVISDANSFFIDTILKHHEIKVDKVLTNPAEFDQNGCLIVNGFHPFPGQNYCGLCPPNLCKGEALKRWKESVGPFHRTVFMADGSGDLCLALQLKKTDQVFARHGYSLLRKLENSYVKDLKARLSPWKTTQDIINNMIDMPKRSFLM